MPPTGSSPPTPSADRRARVRRLRRIVVGWSVAAFVALWGIVYLAVHGDASLASQSTAASTGRTSGDTSSSGAQSGEDPSSATTDDGGFWSDDGSSSTPPESQQQQLPPASTSQS